MDSDEDQQALAWQQIIRNKAFDNVRVQRGESWVDAACRTLDELIDQKEQAEKSLSEFLESQPASRDDEFTQLDETRTEANIQRNRAQREAAVAELAELRESWDRMRRELDEEKSRSQFFAERADKSHGAWQRSAPVPISSADIDRALINVTSNAMNYPTPSQMLGKDTGPLRRKCVDAVCELFGIED